MAIETFEGLPIVDTGGRSLILALDAKKISFPNDGADFGNSGDQLRSLGNGGVEWAAPGMPTYEQTEQAISDWLDAHPEATTTVQDGAITESKLGNELKSELVFDSELENNSSEITKDITLLFSAEPINGTRCQGSHFDIANNVVYMAMVSDDSGTVQSGYGYIMKYNLTTGELIRQSSLLQINHANSIDMHNSKLYVTEYSGSKVMVLDPSTLAVDETLTLSVLGSFTAMAFDDGNELIGVLQGGQYPVIELYKKAVDESYFPQTSFKWNLSGLQLSQGLSIRGGRIAIPSFRSENWKSFIELYDLNENFKYRIKFKQGFEIEDVTISGNNIYFNTGSGDMYVVNNVTYTGSTDFNQFSFGGEHHLYWLNRNISEYVVAASNGAKYVKSVPINYNSISGQRTNGLLEIGYSIFNTNKRAIIQDFSPASNNVARRHDVVYYSGGSAGANKHIFCADFAFTYSASSKTISIDFDASFITDFNISTGTVTSKSFTDALTSSESFLPLTYGFDIQVVTWKSRMLPGTLTNGGMFINL